MLICLHFSFNFLAWQVHHFQLVEELPETELLVIDPETGITPGDTKDARGWEESVGWNGVPLHIKLGNPFKTIQGLQTKPRSYFGCRRRTMPEPRSLQLYLERRTSDLDFRSPAIEPSRIFCTISRQPWRTACLRTKQCRVRTAQGPRNCKMLLSTTNQEPGSTWIPLRMDIASSMVLPVEVFSTKKTWGSDQLCKNSEL